MVIFCLLSYLIVFVVLEAKSRVLGLGSKVGEQETERPTPNAQSAKPNDSGRESQVAGREREGLSLSSNLLTSISSTAFWLCAFVALVLLRYALDYPNAAKSLHVVVLLTGLVVGKGIALWAGASRRLTILTVLTLLLACAALWHPERGMEFQYRGQPRWTGPWDNPNLFGVLMGVGFTLAVGMLGSRVWGLGSGGKRPTLNIQHPTSKVRSIVSLVTRHTSRLLLLAAAVLCAFGLLKSYSRGAWLGTAVGLAWLIGSWVWRLGTVGGLPKSEIGNQKSEMVSFRRCWLPSSILILSILVIAFWQFRHTESPLARRVFSVGNPNDFSWRNRVAAWEGAGRMMGNKPLIGFGWGKAEEVYSKEYRAARLEESAAIQMNDYLMIGISAGTPALACLLGYLLLTGFQVSGFKFQARQAEALELGLKPLDFLPTVCFAGAIVGMVGFWFDGGLFKLPTCVVFWVLVELARAGFLTANDAKHANAEGGASVHASRLVGSLAPPIQCGAQRTARPTIALRWLAGIAALGALGLTALHLGTPQFAVSERTLSVARKFLVPPGERNDFEFLAAKNIWANTPLKLLLQHAHLANYNRTLVNWKLEDQLYREFVLSPEILVAADVSLLKQNAEEIRADSRRLLRDGERVSAPSTQSAINHPQSTDLNWRRQLWEYFYPRIRKESSLEAAAEIVVRNLDEDCKRDGGRDSTPINRERELEIKNSKTGVEISAPTHVGGYKSVLEIWRQQMASVEEFERIYVAALRSVGIPARLATSGQAEFWTGAEWKVAPRPPESTREK